MASASRDGARFQPLPSGPSGPGSSSSRSSFDSTSDPNDADDEAFALLSDDDAVSLLSDDIELEEISTAGPSAGSGSRPAKSRSEMDQRFQDAINAERNMTPRDAIRAYPMAVFWSLVVSLCVIMEGYDTILIGSFFAHPEFAKKFGDGKDKEGRDQLSALWQAVLGNSSTFGCIIGVIANGFLVERCGQKTALISSLFVLSGCIFITFFATNKTMLMLGQIACGLPWGVFASSAPAYASEVLPLTLRVYLTTWTNMCFIIGQLMSAAVLAGLLPRKDEWSYRIPFALQWSWPVLLIPLLVFAPESPWHLVRTGQLDKAEKALLRLQRRKVNNLDAKVRLREIIETDRMEQEHQTGTTYWDCFRGVERRRTEIACVAFAGQVLSGSSFAYNSVYFFQQAGLNPQDDYNLNVGGTALALVGTVVNWVALMPYFGRRRIYLWGMFSMSTILFIIGVLDRIGRLPNAPSSPIGWVQACLTLVWTFIFQLSVGQLGWAIPAEVGSTRLRQKTICVARSTYYVMNLLANAFQPFFINPNALNLKGTTGFVWGTSAFLTFVWAFFRLPETKGRTYEELDYLFHNNTATRQFDKTEVDVFEGGYEKVSPPNSR
ncbi:sugar porter family MFS transporter [Colletotrichum paranaense]|uniref:Sugar porter family MFS transporter n=2 Tax=Colletotrichum acutatum species complex TaxID=2707335 RepID=A0ABQ9PBJ5_9PEZI|nr:sugar porter family MFS transporter [Colletotrichum paranaense]KAK0369388.1 sugar porter family MFS transporter [Colletotrichum limetticola]KAK1535907.1 sugar porter family MFS transporter [Colletotrichum paranaense]